MATPWAAWHPDVLLRVSGAPDPLIAQELNRAARDFFTRTNAWAVWLDGQTVVASDSFEYEFELPPNTEVARVERAAIGSRQVPVLNWRQVQTPDDTQENGLLPAPDRLAFALPGLSGCAGQLVRSRVSLRPTVAALSIDDDTVASEYRDAILAGALARLLSMNGTPWENGNAAAVWALEYQSQIGRAATRVFRGDTGNTPRTRVDWC